MSIHRFKSGRYTYEIRSDGDLFISPNPFNKDSDDRDWCNLSDDVDGPSMAFDDLIAEILRLVGA